MSTYRIPPGSVLSRAALPPAGHATATHAHVSKEKKK